MKQSKWLILLSFWVCTFSIRAQQPFDAVAQKYLEKKYSEAADSSVKKLRELGDMFWRGYPYYHVPKSNTDAIKWYKKAALAGDAYSMYKIGELYERGDDGIQKDIENAAEWYKKAVDCGEQGDVYHKEGRANSMFHLGLLLLNEKISENNEYAWYLIEKAASNGNYWAMQKMGRRYETGDGVQQNKKIAFNWYVKAAVSGNVHVRKIIEKAAKEGNVDAMIAMGDAFTRVGIWINYKTAESWYQKAVKRGSTEAMVKLGILYWRGLDTTPGKSVKKDYAKALKLFKKASDAGNTEGRCMLGLMHVGGYGVKADVNYAEECYRKAMSNGYKDAMFLLGSIFQDGNHGVKPNYSKAIGYYKEAGNCGSIDAMNTLGNLYEKGEIVIQDYLESVKWYEKSASKGDTLASHNLSIVQYKAGQQAYSQKDFVQAFPLLKAASESSINPISDAMILLAGYYRYQQNDSIKAQYWMQRAEEYKNSTALELRKLRIASDLYNEIESIETITN